MQLQNRFLLCIKQANTHTCKSANTENRDDRCFLITPLCTRSMSLLPFLYGNLLVPSFVVVIHHQEWASQTASNTVQQRPYPVTLSLTTSKHRIKVMMLLMFQLFYYQAECLNNYRNYSLFYEY